MKPKLRHSLIFWSSLVVVAVVSWLALVLPVVRMRAELAETRNSVPEDAGSDAPDSGDPLENLNRSLQESADRMGRDFERQLAADKMLEAIQHDWTVGMMILGGVAATAWSSYWRTQKNRNNARGGGRRRPAKPW